MKIRSIFVLTVSVVIAFFIYASNESFQPNSSQPNQYDYFVSETIDVDLLKYRDPWMIWENDDFDNMENGELILLKNLDGDYDISPMEYAVVQKINGVILISQVTKTSFDEILEQKNIEYNDKDQFAVLDTQIEIGATIDIFHTTFSEIEVPIKQINISAKDYKQDQARGDGLVTLGTTDADHDSFTVYPEGQYPEIIGPLLMHETAHVVGDYAGIGSSVEWGKAMVADRNISKTLLDDNFKQHKTNTMLDASSDSIHSLIFGQKALTEYAKDNNEEDWAESFCWYAYDKIYGGIGVRGDGTNVRFSDAYPNRAEFIDDWYQDEIKKKQSKKSVVN